MGSLEWNVKSLMDRSQSGEGENGREKEKEMEMEMERRERQLRLTPARLGSLGAPRWFYPFLMDGHEMDRN